MGERTLPSAGSGQALSAALDCEFKFGGAEHSIKVNVNVKGSGQECPLHTNVAEGAGSPL